MRMGRHPCSVSPASLTLRNALMQGFFVGFGLAVVTIEIFARIKATRINGWITIFGCGEPGNGMFLRAARAQIFPGPVNLPQEAMYWKTNVDGAGHALSGRAQLHHPFPAGRASAERRVLVADHGRRERTLRGESAQSVQRQRSLRSRAKRRRLRRHLSPERRSGRP